jgi:hypothetical protein
MTKPTAATLAADLRKRSLATEYEDLIIAYNVSGNALLLWAALAHCQRYGQPVPDDLLRRLGEYAARLIATARKPAAGPRAFADALDLLAGAKGLTAWERAEQQRRKVRKLRLMDSLLRDHAHCRSAAQAARAVADAHFDAGTLAKDFSRLTQKPPRSASDWQHPNYNPFTAHLVARSKRRKVLPKKAAAR